MLRRVGRPSAGRSATGVRVLAAAAVVLAVLVLLPDRLGLDRWLPFAVFSALRPVLVVVAALGVVAVVAAAVLRRRVGVTSAVATTLVAGVVVLAAVPVVARTVADPPPPPGGRDLTVLTLNAYEGRADPDALAAAIDRARPDLVVLPEAGERYRTLMAARLPAYRAWTNVPPQAEDVRGIVVLAAPRAGDVRPVRLADGTTRYPWVDVTGGILGSTRLVGVHLVSIVPEWIAHWPGELASLQRWCASGAPTLVVGDLNATPDHGLFRSGTAGCTDAATQRGASLTATWRSSVPRWLGAQIDHVLATGGPSAREVTVLDLPRSDHRALLVRMRLP